MKKLSFLFVFLIGCASPVPGPVCERIIELMQRDSEWTINSNYDNGVKTSSVSRWGDLHERRNHVLVARFGAKSHQRALSCTSREIGITVFEG